MRQKLLMALIDEITGNVSKAKTASKSSKAVKSNKFEYDKAKISKQYPDIAPAILAVDKKTGKEFLQKIKFC